MTQIMLQKKNQPEHRFVHLVRLTTKNFPAPRALAGPNYVEGLVAYLAVSLEEGEKRQGNPLRSDAEAYLHCLSRATIKFHS